MRSRPLLLLAAALLVACSSETSAPGGDDPSGGSGESGGTGSSGSAGKAGSSGSAGKAGSSGSAGKTGSSGSAGKTGSSGSAGKTGASGSTGKDAGVEAGDDCTDIPPDDQYTCEEQAGWKKCDETWMVGKCNKSCERCGVTPLEDAGPLLPICAPKFASGLNVAWMAFANDVPNPAMSKFLPMFKNTAASGGRVIRWWFHTDGSHTPTYGADGLATAIPDAWVADLKKLLDGAQSYRTMLVISLWSFDMMRASDDTVLANNRALLTKDANRQAYIDNVLVPMVKALKDHPALYAWEIFNEPEGMTEEFGWTDQKVTMADVQKTVNWLADAIHTEAPQARVTNGTWTVEAVTNEVGASGKRKNYYSDQALTAAGGKTKGTLDFYEAHYYGINGPDDSPFTHPASTWRLDKPLVIGEFWPDDTDGVKANDLYLKLYQTGYAGAWAWQYANIDQSTDGSHDYRWPKMKLPLEALLDAGAADLNVDCP